MQYSRQIFSNFLTPFWKKWKILEKTTRITCAFTCGHYNFQSKVQHRLTHFLENFWFTEDFVPSEPHIYIYIYIYIYSFWDFSKISTPINMGTSYDKYTEVFSGISFPNCEAV